MNLRTIDQISEGQLHDGAHLFSPGSEDRCAVVRDDLRMSNTEIQQNRPLLLNQISSRVVVKVKIEWFRRTSSRNREPDWKDQSKYSHDKMGPEKIVDPQKGNITKEFIHLVVKLNA